MITPEPPAGSEHYREGWRHGYEQAAIDRERSADAARLVPDIAAVAGGDPADVDWNRANGEMRTVQEAILLLHNRSMAGVIPRRLRLRAAEAALAALAGAVPDTGQARYQETACALRPAATSGDPAQPDLAYARSEVDKWLASTDPYCILPTRTEHIPALLARLDELEGTR